MSLVSYKKKRNFKATPEPSDKKKKDVPKKVLTFVIQRHQASHLHYDFRLEMEGVLKSWAVPKGPSLHPKDKRLAMMVEDHPYDYGCFEGEIPKGNYGAGVVEIWDSGTYEHISIKDPMAGEKQLLKDLKTGSLKFILHGKKLKGEFALVKMKGDKPANSWLLIKHDDAYAIQEPYNSEDHTAADSAVTRAAKKKGLIKEPLQTVPQKNKKSLRTILADLSAEKKYAEYIHPMLAKPGGKAFSEKDWLFEVKWDGYRAIAELQKAKIKLYSRNGLSFENKYTEIVAALQAIKHNAVLDGEVVVLDDQAMPSFQLLQHYPDVPEGCTLVYYVFDLLELDGKELYDEPLIERKKKLQKILPPSSVIRYCEHIVEKGETFFKWILDHNLEGMVAKRADSLYHANKRSSEWLKIRNHNILEALICGYTIPKGERSHFGSLLLGMYDHKGILQYVGNVGTGFSDKSLAELFAKMNTLKIKLSPFSTRIKVNDNVTWIKPVLVCNIKYTEWTRDKQLRHPVFMGLRVDKKSAEVILENNEPMEIKSVLKKAKAVAASTKNDIAKRDKKQVKLTNQEKIYFPEDHVTKGDVVNYYQSIYEYIIPYLKNRPESMKRNPNGIMDNGFFHKDAGEAAPDWVKSIPLYSDSANKDIDYILCNDKETLMYMNNLGCIEINPWNSHIAKLDHPDYMVIDIDPSDKNTFEQVIQTALMVKKILDKAGADSYCKTSGATGLHVYVPMGAKYDYDQVKDFARLVAMLVQEQLPDFTTLERSLLKRKNRIYIDYLQNRKGQTLACAYSLRPKVGATVSTPLEWKEVKKGLSPTAFTMHTILKRLSAKGDLFEGVLGKGIHLSSCLKNLMD